MIGLVLVLRYMSVMCKHVFQKGLSVCNIGNSTTVRTQCLADKQAHWATLDLAALYIFGLRCQYVYTHTQILMYSDTQRWCGWSSDREQGMSYTTDCCITCKAKVSEGTTTILLYLWPLFILDPLFSSFVWCLVSFTIVQTHLQTSLLMETEVILQYPWKTASLLAHYRMCQR